MAKLTGVEKVSRGRELEPVRRRAFVIWKQDPNIRSCDLRKILEHEGHKLCRSTPDTWLSRWRHGKGYAKPYRQRLAIQLPTQPIKPARVPEQITWEAIIKAVPDTRILGALVIDGFTAKIQELNEEILVLKREADRVKPLEERLANITEDRKKVFQAYNEILIKVKTGGHFTIDDIQHILIPKV